MKLLLLSVGLLMALGTQADQPTGHDRRAALVAGPALPDARSCPMTKSGWRRLQDPATAWTSDIRQ